LRQASTHAGFGAKHEFQTVFGGFLEKNQPAKK